MSQDNLLKAFSEACKTCNISAIKSCVEQGFSPSYISNLTYSVADKIEGDINIPFWHNRLDIAKYFIENGFVKDLNDASNQAAHGGALDVVKYLHQHHNVVGHNALKWAHNHRRYNVINYLSNISSSDEDNDDFDDYSNDKEVEATSDVEIFI